MTDLRLSRTQVLAGIRSAAYHLDRRPDLERWAASRFGADAVADARDQGATARAISVLCTCGRCRGEARPFHPACH